MSELAFNINGEAFEVPAQATGWRVRKMRAKGSPEVVYHREGPPLVLPISAEIDDLRSEVDATGRYRLDLVDQNNKAIEGAPSGYVQINFDVPPPTAEAHGVSRNAFTTQSDNVVIEAMRMQSMICASVVDKFPQMMEAAATLLRAADGAGLPARPPFVLEEASDDGDRDDEPQVAQSGFDLNTMIAQIVPLVLAGLGSGKFKMPDFGSVFDWRKAAKAAKPSPETSSERTAIAAPTATLPPLDASAMAHVFAIQSALDPKEVAFVQEVAKELNPSDLRGWFDKLSKLSVPEAVEMIRGLIAGKHQKGSAS